MQKIKKVENIHHYRNTIKTRVKTGSVNNHRIVRDDKIIYTDDSYKDPEKRVNIKRANAVQERIANMKRVFHLPKSVNTVRAKLLTDVLLVNKDGRQRELLPDKPSKHKILVHKNIAKEMTSRVCMFVRITDNRNDDNGFIDGSWAIVPAQSCLMRATTIQHVRRRPLFFLRKYWYEISFDGRVQPAHLLYDYNVDPTARLTRLWITREYVPVRKTGKDNDYFRIWKQKGKIR